MATFDVFIPAKQGTDGKNVTVQVEATSWLLALRAGMKQIGEQGETLSSIMVENRPDGSVVVKDPSTRRVFRITPSAVSEETEKHDEEVKKQEVAEAKRLREEAEKQAHEREEAEQLLAKKAKVAKETEETLRKEKEEAKKRAEEERKAAEEKAKEANRAEQKEEERKAAKAEAEAKLKKAEEKEKQRSETAARAASEAAKQEKEARKKLKEKKKEEKKAKEAAMDAAEGKEHTISVTVTEAKASDLDFDSGEDFKADFDVDEVLADLFMATMDILEMDADEAVNFTLDLAMQYLKSEASSIILSDVNSTMADLYFAAARGKVADQLADIKIPRGKGIVGFSVQNGCSLAVNDVNKNENFYKGVSQKTGFETRSILCVPISSNERTLGAIELVNKAGTDHWTQEELNVLEFLAQKIGEHLLTFHDAVSLDVN